MPTKESQHRKRHRREQEFEAVFTEGRYSVRFVSRIARVLREGIDDSDWRGLQRKYKLRDPMRWVIDDSIRAYWDFRVSHAVSKGMMGRLDAAIHRLRDTQRAVNAVRNDSDFFKGVHAYYEKSPMEQVRLIESALASLTELQLLLDQAKKRIKAPRKRPSHRSLWMGLITYETDAYRVTGQKLSFESADHARVAMDVFCFADEKLTARAFGAVLKDYLTVRPEWISTTNWTEDEFR